MAIDPLTAGVIGSAVVGGISTVGSGITGLINNSWNKRFAREQFDYQKDLNRQLMEREDNAVQRRAADLEAAGISKNLAAGSPAQATSLSSGNSGAVAKGVEFGNPVNFVNDMVLVKKTQADIALTNQKAINAAKEAGLIDEQAAESRTRQNLNNINVERTREQISTERYNRFMSQLEGLRTTDVKNSIFNASVSFFHQYSNRLREAIEGFENEDPKAIAQKLGEMKDGTKLKNGWTVKDSPVPTGQGFMFDGKYFEDYLSINKYCMEKKFLY